MKERYDLVVVGGGFAGACAAMAAAQRGVHVLLVEKFNCLGGMAASGLVLPFMGYWTKQEGQNTSLAGGMFQRILQELDGLGGLGEDGKTFDEELLKLVLNRMCQKSGVQLLFNTTITQVQTNGRHIISLKGWGKSCEVELRAQYFIDATGDAELATLAGCACRVGRESDGLCQPMTLSFRLGGVDRESFLKHKPEINPLYRQLQAQGKIKNPRENVLSFRTMHDDVLHLNSTRVVRRDPTDPFDVTAAELEAREQVFELYHMLKEHIPGFENAYVQSTGLQIGIRESRMVEGLYTLAVEDLKGLARFPDAIATANYDIDIHNPEGAGTDHYYFDDGEWYEIPYRCLVPKDCDNLLVAGRCISSTHEAQASYRIMPFCAQLGQAAGTAISVALDAGAELPEVDVDHLRTLLRKDGFMI